MVTMAQKKNIRFLLGRNVRIELPAGTEPSGMPLSAQGTCVAIYPSQFIRNEYCVHVHFDHPLDKKSLLGFVEAGEGRDSSGL